jgi:hypothetical protein
MTEPLVDARELLRGPHSFKVDYVLFGALAMLFYGYVRTTEDLDVVVNSSAANLDRVADWLKSIDARLKLNPSRPFGARERWGMQKGSNATVLTLTRSGGRRCHQRTKFPRTFLTGGVLVSRTAVDLAAGSRIGSSTAASTPSRAFPGSRLGRTRPRRGRFGSDPDTR